MIDGLVVALIFVFSAAFITCALKWINEQDTDNVIEEFQFTSEFHIFKHNCELVNRIAPQYLKGCKVRDFDAVLASKFLFKYLLKYRKKTYNWHTIHSLNTILMYTLNSYTELTRKADLSNEQEEIDNIYKVHLPHIFNNCINDCLTMVSVLDSDRYNKIVKKIKRAAA